MNCLKLLFKSSNNDMSVLARIKEGFKVLFDMLLLNLSLMSVSFKKPSIEILVDPCIFLLGSLTLAPNFNSIKSKVIFRMLDWIDDKLFVKLYSCTCIFLHRVLNWFKIEVRLRNLVNLSLNPVSSL